jgi:hypothetical protein
MTDQKNIEKKTQENNFNQKILENIKGKKPKTKGYFLGLNFLLAAAIFGLILLIGLLVGFALWDTLSVFQNGLKFVLFELILLIFLLLLGLFFLYRQTDFLLVKQRGLVFVGLALMVLFVGVSLVAISRQNPDIERNFESFQGNIERMPHRQNRAPMMGRKMRENGIFGGRVIRIQAETDKETLRENKLPQIPKNRLQNYSLITIQNRQETRTFLIEKTLLEELKLKSDFRPNQKQRPTDFRVDFERGAVVGVGR